MKMIYYQDSLLFIVSLVINIQYNVEKKMGCQSSKKVKDNMKSKQRVQTLVGLLDINIINAGLYEIKKQFNNNQDNKVYDQTQNKHQKKCNAFVKLKVSNQQYNTRLCPNFQKQGQFNSYFSYFINSCYRANGRVLQIQLKHNFQTSGSGIIAKGSLDLQSIINGKIKNHQVKCIISKGKPIGYVNLKATFTPIEHYVLNFRFQSAILRNRASFSIYNLKIQVQIGQEQLHTERCKDYPEKASNWINQILEFYVPKIITSAKITLYDDDKYLGHFQLNLNTQISENQYQETTHFSELSNLKQIIGSIKYSTIIGKGAKFTNTKQKQILHTSLRLNLSKKDLNKSQIKNQSIQKILQNLETKEQKDAQNIVNVEFERILQGFQNEQLDSEQFNKSSNQIGKKKIHVSLFHMGQQSKIKAQQSKVLKENQTKNQQKMD